MQNLVSKLAIASFAIALAGVNLTLTTVSAEAGPGRITKVSGMDLGSGR